MKKSDYYNAILDSPIGKLGIRATQHCLQHVDFLASQVSEKAADNKLTADVVAQLLHYFDNPMFEFSIDCDMAGTAYQQRVWARLQTIASGHCMSYAEVADALQSGARAVGGACRSNPIPIIVPCHRVISKSGIGGYDGDWGSGKVNIKQWLLRHEGII